VLPTKVRECRDRLRQTLLEGELSIKRTTRIIEEELIRKVLRKTGGTERGPPRSSRSATGRCSTRSRSSG